jgi:hypothetical protein
MRGFDKKLALVLLVLILFGVSACSTSMTYTTHPQTLEPGEMQGSVAMQGGVNTNVLTEFQELVDLSRERIDETQSEGGTLTEREYRQAIDAGLALMLFKPTVASELHMRVGVVEGIDAGLRYNGSNIKADVKGRIWQSNNEKNVLSVMAGVGRQTIELPTPIKYITLSEFSRTDADVALMYGAEPLDFLKTYIGPRAVYSWVSAEPIISDDLMAVAPESIREMSPANYFQDENILYVGGTGGVMLGYDWIWLSLEATVMYMNFEPTVIEQPRDLSGWQISPVAGLMFEF